MAKTVTVRMGDKVYDLIRRAADSERRSVSSFLLHAALRYLADEATVSDEEMEGILSDEALVMSLQQGIADARAARYRPAESARRRRHARASSQESGRRSTGTSTPGSAVTGSRGRT